MSHDDEETEGQIRRMQRRLDSLFTDRMPGIGLVAVRQQRNWRPLTDVYETEESLIVKVEIAGMAEEDFAVSLSNRTLSILGVRRDPECKLSYQQLEIPYGHFSTEVFLPYAVDRKEIRATYENGFLTIVLPKVKPRHVQVVDKGGQEMREE
ncbi:MAG: Hsp20/alpha crystallin family protein [Anaerolineae bacterium]|nr:Hsp20/alpha crystallin family protein [Anaerolineae bacterium]